MANIDRAEELLREFRQILYDLETGGVFELEIKEPLSEDDQSRLSAEGIYNETRNLINKLK